MLSLMLIRQDVLMTERVLVERHSFLVDVLCVDDRKSTSGATFFLGGCLVSWLSKKQSTVFLSTFEAEYIAATNCGTQVIWMKQTLEDIHIHYDTPIPIYCDNTSAINISINPVMH
jgi:hypothetical protein